MQGKCTPATSAVAADHLVRLLKDRTAIIAAEEPGKAAVTAHCNQFTMLLSCSLCSAAARQRKAFL
jgi:hypothetical protein